MFRLKTPRLRATIKVRVSISSTEMHGTVSLAELNWFCTPYKSFSYDFTATNFYSHMLDEIL
nr:MAG TPA: hypothetical protein [Caudoviricetes sp.]